MQLITDFILGCKHFLIGAELIFKPGIRRFVLIPLLINCVVFIAMFVIAKHYMALFNHWFLQFLPHWLYWLEYFLWALFFVSFFVLMVYIFTMVANIIASPFNGSLSEAVELYLTKKSIPAKTVWQNTKDAPRVIGRALSMMGYYLPRALVILILFFIPAMQLFAPFIWFLFNAWFMALIYLDSPSDNHQVTLANLHLFIHHHRALTLGFGTLALVTAMIPILNFFTLPIAIAGATHLWLSKK